MWLAQGQAVNGRGRSRDAGARWLPPPLLQGLTHRRIPQAAVSGEPCPQARRLPHRLVLPELQLLFGSHGETGASLFCEVQFLILSPPFSPNQSLAAFVSGEQRTNCDLNRAHSTCLPSSLFLFRENLSGFAGVVPWLILSHSTYFILLCELGFLSFFLSFFLLLFFWVMWQPPFTS